MKTHNRKNLEYFEDFVGVGGKAAYIKYLENLLDKNDADIRKAFVDSGMFGIEADSNTVDVMIAFFRSMSDKNKELLMKIERQNAFISAVHEEDVVMHDDIWYGIDEDKNAHE